MAKAEVLGINARNLKYLHPYNKIKAIRLADDKLATKKLLIRSGIPTPRLYGVIRNLLDFDRFDWNKIPRNFVIKPVHGHGGGGIVLLKSKLKKREFVKVPLKDKEWEDSEGKTWKMEDFKWHILNILEGQFSLANTPDSAMIERRLTRHPVFRKYCQRGLPDIRVIVFNKVPVMAMLRLPTLQSKGKANLALGAVGVGIDITSGLTNYAITRFPRRRILECHPDTGVRLKGLQIPYWSKILNMAQEAQELSGLGFLGVDIGLDRKYGPEILELNARPGLDIQVANLESLASRLERVSGLKIESKEKGIRVAFALFGGEIEKKLEEVSGKKIIGLVEKVMVLNRKGTRKKEIRALIDTGTRFTNIDLDLAKKLGFGEAIQFYLGLGSKIGQALTFKEAEEISQKKILKKLKAQKDILNLIKVKNAHGISFRILIPLTFYLSGKKIITKATVISRANLKYQMVIGRRDLLGFLVDPTE